MREILFRGKRKDNGEWIEGSAINTQYDIRGDKHTYIGIFVTSERYPLMETIEWYEVYPESVSEFSGLNDKNGKKIFEGDIIRFDYIGKNRGVNGVEAVVFENGKFGVKWGWHKELVCLDGFANTTLEVIGNIHDNPELLKGGEE